MQTLWVGTRKGLFAVRQAQGGWRIGKPRFPGEPVSQFLLNPHDGACYDEASTCHSPSCA